MDAKSNFVGALEDLSDLAELWGYYDLLRIPGLVRLLLMDQMPLMDQVNREFRLKISFKVWRFHRPPPDRIYKIFDAPVTYSTVGDSFSPDARDAAKVQLPPDQVEPQDVSRDQLLGLHIMVIEGQGISVRDLVKHMAYVQGLTHGGDPSEPHDAPLLALRRLMTVGDTPVGHREIRAIGRVVRDGLWPLREAVLAKYAPEELRSESEAN